MNQKAIKKLEKAIFGERGMESRFKLPVDLIDVLSSKEYLVLSKRFGLDTGITRTLEDVGKDFGVTKERIRQIEAKALDKIKHWSDIETKKVKNTKSALIKKMPNNLYQEFFTQLLKKAQEKTDLHANVRPQRNFCAATRNGLSYSYIVKTRPDGGCGRVELYIFQGDRATNEETYCGFLENKKKIEEIFGNRLNWTDLATKNSPRVAHKSYIIDYIIPKLTFFGEEGKRNWPELQDKMIDAMSRLEKAL